MIDDRGREEVGEKEQEEKKGRGEESKAVRTGAMNKSKRR